MKCLACGNVNLAPQKFCGECGTKLEMNEFNSSAFGDRSYTPPHLAEKILQSRTAMEGERKQVTVLFCDIANSTPLAARVGPDQMHNVLNAFFGAAMREVHRFEGTINQFLGDGFMALFGAPVSHEDHSRRAVLAALAIRQTIAGTEFQSHAVPLQLRIGLNSGAVVIGAIGDNLRMDYTAVGDTTNVAARIQGSADPDAILISESVYRATQRHIECRPLAPRSLKGKARPVVLYEVLHSRTTPTANHPAGPAGDIVGRQGELGEIRVALDRLQTGVGGVLGIVGDAGLGKSRLMHEARRQAEARRLDWLQGECLSFGRTLSYWPFREVVRHAFGIEASDSGAECWQKVETGMSRLFGEDTEELLPYIGLLLALALPEPLAHRINSLDGLATGHQIFRATLLLFERLALDQPRVVAFEDWHWADASSAALLEHLLPLSDRVPILFVVACRPEQQGAPESFRHATSPSADRPLVHAQTLRLAPLPADDSVRLSERLLGGGALPASVRDMLLRRSEGNPFYLGELVRALTGTRAIERDAFSGDWHATERFETVSLPDTIEGLILARIDRLEDGAKQVLKAAAVVGRSFFYRVLKAITEANSGLNDDLEKLRRAELIEERQIEPELEYVFKHPLIQQATYDSLLEERRRQMHRQVGECIEQLFEGRLDAFYSMLAYHFAKAEDWAKAQPYLFKAAEHADRLAADEEALELYNAVIEASERHSVNGLDPLWRAQLDRKIGDAHFRSGRHAQAEAAMYKALARLGQRPPATRPRIGWGVAIGMVGHLLFGLPGEEESHLASAPDALEELRAEIWIALAGIHFFTDALHYAYDGLQLAKLTRRHPRTRGHILGLSHVGLTLDGFYLYRAAERTHSRALELASLQDDGNVQGMVHQFKGIHCHNVGQWSMAVEHGKRAAELCWDRGNMRYWAAAIACQLLYFSSLGEAPSGKLAQAASNVSKVAAETADRQALGWSFGMDGYLHQRRGEHEAALVALERSCEQLASIPDPRILAHMRSLRCRSLMALRRFDEARDGVEQACKLVRDKLLTGDWCTQTWLVRAELQLALLEMATPASARGARRAASEAIRAMLRQGRNVRDAGTAEAHRVAGTFEWLCGNRERGLTHWERGIVKAQQLGAREAQARLYFERGRRCGVETDLDEAAVLFEQCAAFGELRELQAFRSRAAS